QVADGSRDVDTARQGEKGQFTNLAFVSVLSGGATKARIPVPILDQRRLIVPVPSASEEGTLVGFRVAALERAVRDSYGVQASLFERINKLSASGKERKEALDTVRATLERSRNDHARLTAE